MSEQETKPLSVYEAIGVMMDQFIAIAWTKLGLQPDFATGKIEKDLDEAKAAIDVVGHFYAILEPKLDDEDRRRAQNALRDLRMNYVQKSQGGDA